MLQNHIGDDELQLARRVRRGDELAFDVLFGRYARPLLRIAWIKTGDYEAAGDAVQETLLVLWRRRADVPEQSVFPWLVGVLNLTIKNHSRSLRRHPTAPLDSVPEATLFASPPTDRRETILDLLRSLDRLTEIERRIVVYCAVDDLTYEEAGDRLGLTPQAVARRYQRLRVRLRRTLLGEMQS